MRKQALKELRTHKVQYRKDSPILHSSLEKHRLKDVGSGFLITGDLTV